MKKQIIIELITGAIIIGALAVPGTITGAAVSNLPAAEASASYIALTILAIIAFIGIRKGLKKE